MEEPTAWRLVAALYLAQIENRPVDEAAGQLSLIYGHFPYLTSKTGAMDRSFRDYVAANPIPPIKTPPHQANATMPAN